MLNSLQVLLVIAFPDGYRHASAHAIHAFKVVNSPGGATFCKFHRIADAGPKNLTAHDAFTLASLQPDYNTIDLFNAIAQRKFPSWSLKVQLMSLELTRHSQVYQNFYIFHRVDTHLKLALVIPANARPVSPGIPFGISMTKNGNSWSAFATFYKINKIVKENKMLLIYMPSLLSILNLIYLN